MVANEDIRWKISVCLGLLAFQRDKHFDPFLKLFDNLLPFILEDSVDVQVVLLQSVYQGNRELCVDYLLLFNDNKPEVSHDGFPIQDRHTSDPQVKHSTGSERRRDFRTDSEGSEAQQSGQFPCRSSLC